MSTFLTDLRYAIRMLAKSPAFSIIAVLALGLGIGANTAIFSVVNAVLLRPLPYPDSDRLTVLLCAKALRPFRMARSVTPTISTGVRASTASPILHSLGARLSISPFRQDRRRPIGSMARVTANYLNVLGLKPLIGRDLAEADDVPGCAPVALIGESMWQTRFGRSPKVLGQQVIVDGVAREIVGVLPGSIKFPRLSQIWVPLADMRKEPNVANRGNHPGFSVLGRLKSGATLAQANADLETIAVALEKQYPETNTTRRVMTKLLLEASVGEYRNSLNLLLGAVACVLLIACANVANLQLARALARSKELAVRAALGASRWRLARQLLTESMLLAIFGAAAGVILAIWSLDTIVALSPQNIPRFQETRIDLTALLFTGIVAIGAGILAGLWPAWRISNTSALSVVLHEAGTRGGSGGAMRQRARSAS